MHSNSLPENYRNPEQCPRYRMYSKYGEWIVGAIEELPDASRMAAIIRHSERPEFTNIPVDQWNAVQLTREGELAAKDFGSALVREAGVGRVDSRGWGLERCMVSARKIAEGARLAGSSKSRFSPITDFRMPISDIKSYRKYLKDNNYHRMLMDWLRPDAVKSPLIPYVDYSRHILSRVVNERMKTAGSIAVISTHDLYILPIMNDIFGLLQTEVGFMDGILIAENGDSLDFYSKDSHRNLRLSELRDPFQ